MKTIKLTKMQGCGNDFVIIDYSEYEKTGMKMEDLAKKVCNRNFGVGADGMIIPKTNTEETDLGWYFYNSDGSTAQMCGNGMRCFAKYAYDNKLVDKKAFSVQTLAGVIKPELLDNNLVKVNMGKPVLEDKKIPFWAERKITVLDRKFDITPVSMGNPHAITLVDDIDSLDIEHIGPMFEKKEIFPEQVNTEFIQVVSRDVIKMRVWERGSGETLACGTGACASVVACVLNGLTEDKVTVKLLGGDLFIEYNRDEDAVYMTGPARITFTGEFNY